MLSFCGAEIDAKDKISAYFKLHTTIVATLSKKFDMQHNFPISYEKSRTGAPYSDSTAKEKVKTVVSTDCPAGQGRAAAVDLLIA